MGCRLVALAGQGSGCSTDRHLQDCQTHHHRQVLRNTPSLYPLLASILMVLRLITRRYHTGGPSCYANVGHCDSPPDKAASPPSETSMVCGWCNYGRHPWLHSVLGGINWWAKRQYMSVCESLKDLVSNKGESQINHDLYLPQYQS